MNRKVKALLMAVETQVPDYPEAHLMYSVFERAVLDAFSRPSKSKTVTESERMAGRRYLRGDMYHLAMLGIDAGWVRRKMADAGIRC